MRAKITITFEYEIKPEYYKDLDNFEEMLALDLGFFNDDPCEALANNDFTMKGELID